MKRAGSECRRRKKKEKDEGWRVGGEDHKGFRWRPLGKKASRQLVKKESVSLSNVHHKKGQPLVVVSVESV